MKSWQMRCMICNQPDTNLTRIQEHLMGAHGYSVEELRAQSKRQPSGDENTYIYTLPDGTDWLYAERAVE
jgi:hypothetical protein